MSPTDYNNGSCSNATTQRNLLKLHHCSNADIYYSYSPSAVESRTKATTTNTTDRRSNFNLNSFQLAKNSVVKNPACQLNPNQKLQILQERRVQQDRKSGRAGGFRAPPKIPVRNSSNALQDLQLLATKEIKADRTDKTNSLEPDELISSGNRPVETRNHQRKVNSQKTSANKTHDCGEFYCSGLDCAKQILQNRSYRKEKDNALKHSLINQLKVHETKNSSVKTKELPKTPPPLPPKIPLKKSDRRENPNTFYSELRTNKKIPAIKTCIIRRADSVRNEQKRTGLRRDLENSSSGESEIKTTKRTRVDKLYLPTDKLKRARINTMESVCSNSENRENAVTASLENRNKEEFTSEIEKSSLGQEIMKQNDDFELVDDNSLAPSAESKMETKLSDEQIQNERKRNNSKADEKRGTNSQNVSSDNVIDSVTRGVNFELIDDQPDTSVSFCTNTTGDDLCDADVSLSTGTEEPMSISLISSQSHPKSGTGGSDSGVSSGLSPPISNLHISSQLQEAATLSGIKDDSNSKDVKKGSEPRTEESNSDIKSTPLGVNGTDTINIYGRSEKEKAIEGKQIVNEEDLWRQRSGNGSKTVNSGTQSDQEQILGGGGGGLLQVISSVNQIEPTTILRPPNSTKRSNSAFSSGNNINSTTSQSKKSNNKAPVFKAPTNSPIAKPICKVEASQVSSSGYYCSSFIVTTENTTTAIDTHSYFQNQSDNTSNSSPPERNLICPDVTDRRQVPISQNLPIQIETLAHSASFLPISPPLPRPLNRTVDLSNYEVASCSNVAVDDFSIPYLSNNEHLSSNSVESSHQHNSKENSVVDSTLSEISSERTNVAVGTNDDLFCPLAIVTSAITPTFQEQGTQTIQTHFQSYQQAQFGTNDLSVNQPLFNLHQNFGPTYDFIDDPVERTGTQVVNPIPGLVYEITTTVTTRVPYEREPRVRRPREKHARQHDANVIGEQRETNPRKLRRSQTLVKKDPATEECPIVSNEDFRNSDENMNSSRYRNIRTKRNNRYFNGDERSASSDKLLDGNYYQNEQYNTKSSRLRTSSYENAINQSRNNLFIESLSETYEPFFSSRQPNLTKQFRSQQLSYGNQNSELKRAEQFGRSNLFRPLNIDVSQDQVDHERQKARSYDHLRTPPIALDDFFNSQPRCAPLTTTTIDKRRFYDPVTGSRPQTFRRNHRRNTERPKSIVGCISASSSYDCYEDDNFLSGLIRTFTSICTKKQNRKSVVVENPHRGYLPYQCGMTFPDCSHRSLPPPSSAVIRSNRFYPEVTGTLSYGANVQNSRLNCPLYHEGFKTLPHFSSRNFNTNSNRFEANNVARHCGWTNSEDNLHHHYHNPYLPPPMFIHGRGEGRSLVMGDGYLPNYTQSKDERVKSRHCSLNACRLQEQSDRHHQKPHNQRYSSRSREPQVDPVTKYLRAARNGRQDEMLALLQQYAHHGVHVEVCNSSGLNALHLAAKEGHLHIAQLLMDAGIDIHAMTKKGNTALHIAALSGHLPLVKLLVSRGANVNSVTPERGFTPLYMAAQENHLAVVKYLVDQGADVNLLTDDGFSPLAVAVQQRHADIVSFLLRLDSSATGGTMNANYNPTGTMNSTLGGKDSSNYNTLNSVTSTHRRQRSTSSNRRSHLPDLHIAVKKDDSKATSLLLQQASADPNVKAPGSGFTALHLAAHYGYVSIAQILLTHGADPNVPAGKDNISALHVAAKCGQTEMTRMLLGHGAEPNAKTKDGLTALHLASRNGHEDVVDCLLLHGGGGMIEFRSKTKSGLTALHLAAQANVPEGQDCTQGHIACGRLLIFHGIHVDEISRDLLTPLHISAHCGHVAMAKYLLQHYANPDARALNGFAPLHVAVRKRRIPVIILLLEYYADVNISTESGLTPMHVAAFVGAEQAMHLLLKSGAAVNAESALGERPLHLAVRANNLKLAELLLSCGSDVDARTTDGGQTCLHLAARANSTPMCELLLKHGANPSNFASSSGGHSVLHAAARDGALECVQMLLQRGVDPNCRTLKGGELTALHLAAKYGHMEVCRLLLAHGASPDIAATSASCFTPLHLAVMNGHSDVAALLLQSGASANSIAANGLSPLHMAVSRNSVEMCQRLVDQGAFPDAQTKWGESPAHTAARLGFLEMLKFLYQYCDANLYIASPLGVTPLHMAAQEDKTVVCRFLIEECRPFKGSGINNPVEMRTKSGYTALHMAVYHNCVSTVLYLLQCGRCNPNWQTGVAGYTPLHVAAQQGNTSLAQYLLRANCQPDLRTNCGATALVIASKLRYVTLVDLLKRVTTTPVTLTPEIENEIRSFRTPESIQDATQWGENVVGGQNNIAEQEDEIDYPETEDMNCFLAPADLQFLTKDADNLPLLSAVSTRSLPRSGTQTPTQFESYASFNKYLSPNRGDYGSRPPSGTSNISGYTTTSYGDNLLLSPVNAGSLMARLSISDLAHVRTFEQQVPSDNVESMPNKLSAAGFLISFVADAKGCRMRAARGNRLCFIIPARSCEQPQRITCRHVRRHKLIAPPPLAEDQALAARVLELGPVGSKFTGGPIIVEVPYVASLSNGEREIAVFTFSPKQSGGEWTEHKQPEIQARIKMLLDSHLEDQKSPNSRRSSGTFGESSKSDDSNPDQRLERVILTEIPQYIALVSRLKKDKADITPLGGIISSSVEARVQLSFPEKAVKKDVKISLHVLRIRSDIISRLLTNPQGLVTASNMFHCSPVVTIEPRKRQFHERFTICVPSPIPGVENNSGSLPRRPSFGAQSGGIRLLRSVTDSIHPAVWEDITDQTRLGELQNGCVTFSSKVSARFWLVHSPKPRSTPELLKIAHAVYNEAIKVPYMAKFIVFAKRHAENEARLRLFCVTDDKHEGVMSGSTLESQENFTQIAKSRDVEVFDGNRNYLDWDANSNLFPVQHPLNSFRSTPMVSGSKEDEGGPYGGNQEQQLSLTFWAFKENRIHFFVQVKDTMYIQNGTPSGRLQIYNSGRSHLKSLRSEADLLQLHICTLSLNLPNIYASAGLDNGSGAGKDINHLVNFASAGERRRDPTGRLCEPNLSPDSSAERALLRLTVVADSIGSDWQKLGMGLGIDPNNLNIIDLQVGNGSQSSDGENTADSQKAYRMLHHWAEYQGVNATGAALEKALNNIGRGEINPKWRKPVFRAPGGGSIDRSSKDLDSRETPEENNDSRVVRKLTRVIRVDPDGTRHEYLQEVDPRDTTGASKSTDELIERAIADSPFSSENGNAAGEKVETTVRNVVIDREVVKKTIIVDGKEQVVIEPYPPRSPSQASSHLPNQNVSPTYLNGSPVDSNVSGPGTSQIPSNQNPTNGTVYSAEDDSELQTALDNYIQSNHQP